MSINRTDDEKHTDSDATDIDAEEDQLEQDVVNAEVIDWLMNSLFLPIDIRVCTVWSDLW